jgi:alpha-glucosidase
MPWRGDAPPFGFGPGTGQPWIPQPKEWAELTVEQQSVDPSSTLAFYRAVLAQRRTFATTAGDEVEMLDVDDDVLAFRRGPLTVVLNTGTAAVELPAGEVVASSGPVADGVLPADTAVWLR